MNTTVNLTVAIPTYNGENRLPQVLDKLKEQVNTENINWEVIVIDNNSNDGTAKLVKEYQENWLQDVPLKYYFESQQGISFARQRAINEAQGELVGFIDDDNLPFANWVSSACNFAQEHPKAGAFSSKIHGVFEKNPSEELKQITFYLALVDRGSEPLMYEPRKKGLPPGAGMVVRRNIWQKHVPEKLLLIGKTEKSQMPIGEDAEALLYIYKAGWEIWYNAQMEIEHMISSSRVEEKYLMSLMKIIGLGRFHLRMLMLDWWQRPFAFFVYLINDLRKTLVHFIRYKKVLAQDIVAACEMQRLVATLISPFYLWRMQISNFMRLY
ncbi:MAG: hormogonium polysaccharide biosynthesis glycosyltransferase HpsE [Cyanobacteriota bacterium]|nr:hormogonium polysaccharide biosynthesis glycosyltransferase HpsE [Cyanobacteriota bacterium]